MTAIVPQDAATTAKAETAAGTRNSELVAAATRARQKAYAPYSLYTVGAALRSTDGRIFIGCNVENAAFSATNCAERTAFFTAIAEGVRDFEAIAVVGAPAGASPGTRLSCSPCGVCRQVMAEFCDPDHFTVLLARSLETPEDHQAFFLRELLPQAFAGEATRELER
ncbi:MAG: cytidine deaminase [Bacillota bacterium]|nr:cytidine deaminase [Bacillota bacterium]